MYILNITNVIGPAKFDHLSIKNRQFLSSLHYHNSITIYTSYHNKILITTVEFNGLSSAAYRNGKMHSEWKILANIELSVICAQMVDFCRSGH